MTTVNALHPWPPEAVALAQRYSMLWLKIHFDGTYMATITAIMPFEDGDTVPVTVDRGRLYALNSFWLYSGGSGGSLCRIVGGSKGAYPVDGVPWEIHGIEDPIAYQAARQAFISACHDPLP